MTNPNLFQCINEFEAIVTTIVNQRSDSENLYGYHFPKFKKHLESVQDILVMRRNITEQLHTINNLASDKFGSDATYQIFEKNISFSHLRLSLMQNYMATNWSLYDHLSDLSGIDPLAEKKSSSEIFQFDRYCFMNSGKVAKHAVFVKLRETYDAYLGLSYALRNWILHDGLFSVSENRNLFATEMPVKGDRFIIPKESWHALCEKVETEYKTSLDQSDIPKNNDVCLLKMLDLFERHNDQLFAHLIGYTGQLLRLNKRQYDEINPS